MKHKVVHFDDQDPKYTVVGCSCTGAVKCNVLHITKCSIIKCTLCEEEQLTKDWKQVTCKNCLRIR